MLVRCVQHLTYARGRSSRKRQLLFCLRGAGAELSTSCLQCPCSLAKPAPWPVIFIRQLRKGGVESNGEQGWCRGLMTNPVERQHMPLMHL